MGERMDELEYASGCNGEPMIDAICFFAILGAVLFTLTTIVFALVCLFLMMTEVALNCFDAIFGRARW